MTRLAYKLSIRSRNENLLSKEREDLQVLNFDIWWANIVEIQVDRNFACTEKKSDSWDLKSSQSVCTEKKFDGLIESEINQ